MKNLSVIGKFVLVMMVFAVFVTGAAFFSTSRMSMISEAYSDLIGHKALAALSIARVNRSMQAAHAALGDMMIATEDSDEKIAEAQLQQAKDDIRSFLAAAIKSNPARASEFDALKVRSMALLETACALSIKLGMMPGEEASVAAQKEYLKNCAPGFPAIANAIRDTADSVTKQADEASQALSNTTDATIRLSWGIILGGMVLVTGAGFFTIRASVSKPLTELSLLMERLASGDYATAIPNQTRKDEVGAMSRAVQVFKDAGIDKVRLERETEDQRRSAEQERAQIEAERKVVAEQLATVVESLGSGLSRLSMGDLTCDMTEAFSPEYDRLRTDFNKAVAELRNVVGSIIANTGALRSGTGEISQAADDLS